ncbi:MAG: hypothetical protein WBX00_13875, partial [Isosphaeraceae bacterium]
GALGWELSYLLTSAGATGIDVGAALRPETHHQLTPANLVMVHEGPADQSPRVLTFGLGREDFVTIYTG